MSARTSLSTAGRILRQLHHDKRTVAMILVLPAVLLTIVRAMYSGQDETFDRVGLTMLGIGATTAAPAGWRGSGCYIRTLARQRRRSGGVSRPSR